MDASLLIARLIAAWTRWLHAYRERHGWFDCPVCGTFMKPRWVKDWIVDPEEPPLFYHYECPHCGASTAPEPSSLTEHAVRDLGFRNFDHFAETHLQPKEEPCQHAYVRQGDDCVRCSTCGVSIPPHELPAFLEWERRVEQEDRSC